jgi:hypothetical protein
VIAVSTLILAVPASQADGSSSGAAVGHPARTSTAATDVTGELVRSRSSCPHARRAVSHFRALTWARQKARGGELADRTPVVRGRSCTWARLAAQTWKARARSARRAWERWWRLHPKLSGETPWHVSMRNPVNRNLIRLAICETGGINGGQPLWTHHNSVYSGALGFAHSTWAHWRHYVKPLPPPVAAHASPAEQLAVGRALVRTFGGYSSWPACHRRLGLG